MSSDAPAATPVERWTIRRFLDAFPGTTRKNWLDTFARELMTAGVLRKVGKGWLGRRSEIEDALLGRLAPVAHRRGGLS
jgi:hypothetical protein